MLGCRSGDLAATMYREKVRPEVEKLAWAKYKCRGRQDKVRPEVERAA